ncbi:MAG: hypothetical protein R3B91_17330 [Planctomycetaceae bacterium]
MAVDAAGNTAHDVTDGEARSPPTPTIRPNRLTVAGTAAANRTPTMQRLS